MSNEDVSAIGHRRSGFFRRRPRELNTTVTYYDYYKASSSQIGAGKCYQLKQSLREYSRIASIHGIRYLFEKRSICEKVFWGVILLTAILSCLVIFVLITVVDYDSITISYNSLIGKVFRLPFPAVTVCPETRMWNQFLDIGALEKKVLAKESLTKNESDMLQYINIFCPISSRPDQNKTVGEEFFDELKKFQPPFFEMAFYCKLWGNLIPCKELFTPVITFLGTCYAFNMADRSVIFTKSTYFPHDLHQVNQSSDKWYPGFGYHSEAEADTYPFRGLRSGIKNSFEIRFQLPKHQIETTCSKKKQGFRVLIHNPATMPHFFSQTFEVRKNRIVSAAITPDVAVTDVSVLKMSLEKRKCYRPEEKEMQYFRVYSEENCLMNCISEYTLQTCNCVGFFMPRNRSVPICGEASQSCLEKALVEIDHLDLEYRLSKKNTYGYCNCIPACNSLRYKVDISEGNWDWKNYYKEQWGPSVDRTKTHLNYDETEMSRLIVYFKSNRYLEKSRHKLYGYFDTWAKCGGFLGLFTGISIITIIEIFYFFIMKCIKKLN